MAPWSGRKSRLLSVSISERGHRASAIAPETAGVIGDAHGLGDPGPARQPHCGRRQGPWLLSNKALEASVARRCVTGQGYPGGSDGRICLQCRRHGFDPWVGKIL